MKYIAFAGFLAGTLLIFTSGCASKPEAPHYTWTADAQSWRDAETGFSFPAKVGDFVKTGEYRFLPDALYGRAVAYELPGHANLKVCVYLYRYGLDEVTDCHVKNVTLPAAGKAPPMGNPMLDDHRDRVVADFQKAHEDDHFVKGDDQQSGFYFADRSRLDCNLNRLAWTAKDDQDNSYIVEANLLITATNNSFIKIQANYPQAEAAAIVPALEKFREQFFEQLLGVQLGYQPAAPAKK